MTKREAKIQVKNNAPNWKRTASEFRKVKSPAEMNWEKGGLTGDETAPLIVYLQKEDDG